MAAAAARCGGEDRGAPRVGQEQLGDSQPPHDGPHAARRSPLALLLRARPRVPALLTRGVQHPQVDYDISEAQIDDIRSDYEAARDWEVRASVRAASASSAAGAWASGEQRRAPGGGGGGRPHAGSPPRPALVVRLPRAQCTCTARARSGQGRSGLGPACARIAARAGSLAAGETCGV